MIDLREVLIAGHTQLRAAKAAKEATKLGVLRIGNAGILAADGQVYGACHRVSLARLLGYQQPPSMSSRIMFMAGERNEDSWVDVLTAAGWEVDKDTVIDIKNSAGRSIQGHPDIILKQDGKPVMGLELKGIYGATTLESVLKGVPKNDNLIQMAAYSLYTDLPFALCYTLPSWTKIGSTQHQPLYRIFYAEWRGDVLWYQDETDRTAWFKTLITKTAIRAYYELADQMITGKTLGERPTANYVDGTRNKRGPDSICHFCPYKSACGHYDLTQDYDKWIDDVANSTEEQA